MAGLKIFSKKFMKMNFKQQFEAAGITYEHRLD